MKLASLADTAKSSGKKVKVSGYHDATGNLEQNEALAKQRALGVREQLRTAGVNEANIELDKPALTQGAGDDAQARRVEVLLLQ